METYKALQVMEVEPPYDLEELRQRYRQLALKRHPDTGGTNQMMKELNQAYEKLKAVDPRDIRYDKYQQGENEFTAGEQRRPGRDNVRTQHGRSQRRPVFYGGWRSVKPNYNLTDPSQRWCIEIRGYAPVGSVIVCKVFTKDGRESTMMAKVTLNSYTNYSTRLGGELYGPGPISIAERL